MKLLSILATLVFSSYTFASKEMCLAKLTYDYALDSRSFKVDTDEIDILSHDNDSIAQAIEIIRATLYLHGCDGDNDINFGKGAHGRAKQVCNTMVSGRLASEVCYIESDLGYFFVTKDLQTTAHIIFNRWD